MAFSLVQAYLDVLLPVCIIEHRKTATGQYSIWLVANRSPMKKICQGEEQSKIIRPDETPSCPHHWIKSSTRQRAKQSKPGLPWYNLKPLLPPIYIHRSESTHCWSWTFIDHEAFMGDHHTTWFGESITRNKFTEADCAYFIFLMVSREQVCTK